MGVARLRIALANSVLVVGVVTSMGWTGSRAWRVFFPAPSYQGIGAISYGAAEALLAAIVVVGTIGGLLTLAARWRPVSAPRGLIRRYLLVSVALLAGEIVLALSITRVPFTIIEAVGILLVVPQLWFFCYAVYLLILPE